ncbi:uncharacterized protein LOC105248284 [Camponotus floridanus]|uniref:uncharacterized protein LOC105248284 n=1 Tax=Camponotus floridanus TaxID=104421 RepID=UPI000DC6C54F|nr:uncharacterized protein LOC105248284 [Camponotus floridanus]
MRFNITQCNLNHAWGAHNLLHQHMLEKDILFALISEPVCIPVVDWQGSRNGKAAICWKSKDLEYQCKLDKQGTERLRCCKVLIGGDFNSKSEYWGSSTTDAKGELVEEWAVTHGLVLVNTGTTPTCVRPQGESVIDLTWATPSMVNLIARWTVDVESLTLSDHRYIQIQIGKSSLLYTKKKEAQSTMRNKYPRWSWRKMDTDMFVEVLELSNTTWKFQEEDDPNDDANKIVSMISDAADMATNRIKHPERGKQAY